MQTEVVRDIPSLKQRIKEVKQKNLSIGFVPTMGFLHEGHLSLMRAARAENDFLVISIFVNPLQFSEGEDYEEYPRALEKDTNSSAAVGCNLIFSPPVKEMYPRGYSTFVSVEKLTEGLCGASRPGHFRGVTTVVTKLINLVSPDRIYFGQKDAQQAIVLRKMVRDLNFSLLFNILPTIREPDGLALSSRNVYLTPGERKEATVIYRGLQEANDLIRRGERKAEIIKKTVQAVISTSAKAQLEYIAIVETEELKPVTVLENKCLIAVAVTFGETRLIDNIIVDIDLIEK